MEPVLLYFLGLRNVCQLEQLLDYVHVTLVAQYSN